MLTLYKEGNNEHRGICEQNQIAISEIEPPFLCLLQLALGKGDVDILADYHQTGRIRSDDEGPTQDVICFLTEDRIFELESKFENGSQSLRLSSWAFEEVASYEIDSTALMDSPRRGSWLAVNGLSISFRDGKRLDLRSDSKAESNPLEEFARKVVEMLRDRN